jgi:glycosyltransferase involved in cell wall biosynthesis
MRVTLVTETYFPQVNGVSRTLGELARFLTQGGDRVQLLHPNYGEAPAGEQSRTVRALGLPFYQELRIPLPPFGSVHRAITSFRPELVHVATEATLGLSILRYALKRRIPVVSSFHTNFDQYTGHYRLGWMRGLTCRYLRWFHNSTKETYVPSEATIRLLDSFGFERMVLWKRGVDSDLFRPDVRRRAQVRAELGWGNTDLVITYVSRIAPEKNVGYLAGALKIVVAQRPDVRIMLVGDGPSRPVLEREIGGFARFVGYRRGEDLARHYAASDIFAFSSLTETFGNVVLEAMASGLPVVALRAGGVGDTVRSGITGFLVEPADPPARFASALLKVIDQPDVRQTMAHAAREYAVSQSWDAIMAGLRQRYQCVIDESAGLSLATACSPR